MKRFAMLTTAYFAFTLCAAAQQAQVQDKAEAQPPPVTRAQVEQDAKLAQEERKRHEESRRAIESEKSKKPEQQQVAGTLKTSSKKTSTRPKEQ